MIFPFALLIPLAASAACFLWFHRQAGGAYYWSAAAKVAAIIGFLRISLVVLGAYFVEETSGWLQVPGYAMTLCSLPEAVWMPRTRWWSAEGISRLAALILAGSAAWTFALAGLAVYVRRPESRTQNR